MVDDNLETRAARLRPPRRAPFRWRPHRHPAASARTLTAVFSAAATIGLVAIIFAAAPPATVQLVAATPPGPAPTTASSSTRPPAGAPPAPDPAGSVVPATGLPTTGSSAPARPAQPWIRVHRPPRVRAARPRLHRWQAPRPHGADRDRTPGHRAPGQPADHSTHDDPSRDFAPAPTAPTASGHRRELMQVAPAWSDTTFACMGSTARLLILGGPSALPEHARRRLVELEGRWSRFIPGSELCRLNAAAGAPVVVSAATFAVIELAVAAWRATDGRFDPTVLDALELAGYDRDFSQIAASPTGGLERPPEGATSTRVDRSPSGDLEQPPDLERHPTPGCGDIELDRLVSAIRLPRGVHLDLGGIGKGHAADVLAAELLDAGADGVCMNLGGDVRVAGVAPEAAGWQVDLDPALTRSSGSARSFRLGAGAVATTTRLRRQWTRAGEPQHHLIDPGTGRPAWNGLATVTVLADRAAWAEMLAKSTFVAGPVEGAELLRAHHVTGLFVRDDGQVEELAGLEAYRKPAPPMSRS